MVQKERFYLGWMILNPIGFTLGSWLGASSNGIVPSLVPDQIGLILGDLIFGATIGLFQYWVIRRTDFLPVAMSWIPATSIGFMLGARVGSLLTFRITENWSLAGIIFGIFMGSAVGGATAVSLVNHAAPVRILLWLLVSITAWILGESIAFAFLFSFETVPFVALAIAAVTGLGLIHLRSHIKTTEQK